MAVEAVTKTRSPKLTAAEADPEWLPQQRQSTLAVPEGPSHYALRPRPAHKKFTEVEDEDDMEDIQVSGTTPNSDLVITISQLKRCRDKATLQQPIVAHPRNEDLPCIPFPIANFDDLYRLAQQIQATSVMYKDCQRLTALLPVLNELHAMVGLRGTKDALCHFILFELQNTPCYWRHMVITGAPGVGKTSIAVIIAKILNRLGRTPSDEITRGNPLNLISDFEGQTKSEVNRVVQEALSKSGVLLIDEAPALYDRKNRDSYGKKCLDMLMQLMDTHREELIVIFAGYKHDMDVNILQSNEGFRRRIQWFFHLDDYTPEELYQIFVQKVTDTQFTLQTPTRFGVSWFQEHYTEFPYLGGSVENWVHKIRTVHTRKSFGFGTKTQLPDETIEEGFRLYLQFTIEPLRAEKQKQQQREQFQRFTTPFGFMGGFPALAALPATAMDVATDDER